MYVSFMFSLIIKVHYICKHCSQSYAKNQTCFAKYLKKCTAFQKTISKESQHTSAFSNAMNARTTSQSEINFPRLTAKQKLELDIKAAMWCFMGNHAFTMFENPFGKSFLQSLNPAYIPPSRHAIPGRLLDAVYSQVRTQTDELIASLPHINVITDESTNINKARICNISIHSEHGSTHYLSEDILAKRMTTSAAAEWLRNHLLTLSNGDLSRLNSLGTDTCKVMLNMCLQLQQYDDLKHCFFIPCDSHGIQLLIKDLLQIPRFQEVLKQAQTVVKAFRKAPLQYARLRTLQMHFYKRHPHFIRYYTLGDTVSSYSICNQ